MFAGDGDCLVLVVFRVETVVVVKHGNTFFQNNARHLAVFRQDFLWPPAAVDGNAFLFRLGNLVLGGGHDVAAFQAEHGYFRGTAAAARARHVDGHVAAAQHDAPAGNLVGLVRADRAQEIDGGHHAFSVLTLDARFSPALAADGDVKCLVAFRPQVV